jgi:hypothetical protein
LQIYYKYIKNGSKNGLGIVIKFGPLNVLSLDRSILCEKKSIRNMYEKLPK